MKNNTYLLLGSNQGDRQLQLTIAQKWLAQDVGNIVQYSSIYETAAWGKTNQNGFLNQVLMVETDLSCHDLLKKILAIEQKMGRERVEKWGERIIDIDILFYNNIVINETDLVVPHPYLHLRRFTLVPMAELNSNLWHPVLSQTVADLLAICPDDLAVTVVK